MPVPVEVRPYLVFVDRVVVMRVVLEATAENASEAARFVVRELEGDHVDLSHQDWQEVATEYRTPFVHRAEHLPILLKERNSV
jgi:hypothetical protein